MKFNDIVRAFLLVAAVAVVFSAADAQAGLFNRGGDCCEPVCCDPCDDGGFLSRLRDRGNDCCEDTCCEPEPVCCEPEPAPCCEAEPAPCCEAEPVCCEAEPAPCCEPEPCCDPCDPCCEEKGGFLSRLRGLRDRGNDCCESTCCEAPVADCGCEAAPVSDCGCEATPVVAEAADCGCNG